MRSWSWLDCSGSSSTICSLSSKRSCCGDGPPGVCFDLVELVVLRETLEIFWGQDPDRNCRAAHPPAEFIVTSTRPRPCHELLSRRPVQDVRHGIAGAL